MGISTVLARFKADFGLFRPFWLPADTTQYGRYARFWPNQPGSAQVETESARIREKKKKAHKRHRRVGNRVGLGCGTLPAVSVLSSCLPISLRIMLVCHGPAIFCFNSAETLISHYSSLSWSSSLGWSTLLHLASTSTVSLLFSSSCSYSSSP